jgi:TrmH family RNA methyltransferase|tara:strand:- start:131 stop:949 length:819 start_codon:yes stop_codon:yes gene_type:complete
MSSQRPEVIRSLKNPLIKQVVKLRDRRWRDRLARFPIEGYREVLQALNSSVRIESLLICPGYFLGENENALIELAVERAAEIQEIGKDAFLKISYRDRPDGLLAIAAPMNWQLSDIKLGRQPLVVVIEAIEKPGNLGTILRSADAVGADAVIVCDPVTDIYNPNVVRASIGTLFTRPVVQTAGAACIEWLRDNGITIVATSPDASANHTDSKLAGSIAIVMGSEQYGLSDPWLREADEKVAIPMRGRADSLNVAMATTLVLYEVLRQREKDA